MVLGRDSKKINDYIEDMRKEGFNLEVANNSKQLCESCNLVVTTTNANESLIKKSDIKPGTHITAVGSDTPEKRELDSKIFSDSLGNESISYFESRLESFRENNYNSALSDTYRTLDYGFSIEDYQNSFGFSFENQHVKRISDELKQFNLPHKVMIDCSHGNSNKDFRKQSEVLKNVAAQISNGEKNILGVMLESHLKEGNQKLLKKEDLEFGRSITDACIDIETTKELLAILYLSLIHI